MSGRHASPLECIDALRDRIAEMELRRERRPSKSDATPQGTERRGGFRQRPDARMVILDGERLTLTEGARRLGLTGSTLHFRIVNRTGTTDYGEVDIRAIRADVAMAVGKQPTRFVVLDAERVSLAEAARRLEIPSPTLRQRLINRIPSGDYQNADVRAVGADVRKTSRTRHPWPI
jgi:hypothetical protein